MTLNNVFQYIHWEITVLCEHDFITEYILSTEYINSIIRSSRAVWYRHLVVCEMFHTRVVRI